MCSGLQGLKFGWEGLATGKWPLQGAAEAEGVGVFAEGGDTEGDVIVEGEAEFFSAFDYVFAGDAPGECFVFHTFFHGAGFEIEDAFRGANQGAGDKEAGEFVTSEERVFQRRLAGNVAVVRVGEDGAGDFLGVPALSEDFGAFGRMLAVGGVVGVGPALVIEVVEERGEAPGVFVGAVLTGIGANAGFDGEHVLAEAFGLGEFADDVPGVFARGHGGS